MKARLAVAGVRVALSVNGPIDAARFAHRFAAYETRAEVDASLVVFIDRTAKIVAADAPYPAVRAFTSNDGIKLLREGLSMWIDTRLAAEAFVNGPEKPLPLAYEEDAGPLDTPLRILVSHAALRLGRGALVHACGFVARDGRAIAFAGASGTGKTTIARALPAEDVLSDDQIAVRVDVADAPHVEATPFVGAYGRASPPRSARLAAFVVLDGARDGSARIVARDRAVAAIAATIPVYTRTPADAEAALAVAAHIAASVPVVRGSPDLAEGVDVWRARVATLAQ